MFRIPAGRPGILAAVGALAIASTACAGDDSPPSVKAGDEHSGGELADVPPNLTVSSVHATDDAGWVVGTVEGQPLGLWKILPDRVRRVTDLPDAYQGLAVHALTDGLAVAAIQCYEATVDDEPCGAWFGELIWLDEHGDETARITVVEGEGQLNQNEVLFVYGEVDETVWANAGTSLIGATPGGNLTEAENPGGGLVCAFDSGLFELQFLGSTHDPDGPLDTGEPARAEGSAGDSDGPMTYQVASLVDGTWNDLEAERWTVDQPGPPACGANGFVFNGANGVLKGQWSPDQGWTDTQAASSADVERMTRLGDDFAAFDEGFALRTDGSVMERQADGTFANTSVELPVLDQLTEVPDGVDVAEATPMPAAPLEAAASSRFVIGCITGWRDESRSTVCDVAEN